MGCEFPVRCVRKYPPVGMAWYNERLYSANANRRRFSYAPEKSINDVHDKKCRQNDIRITAGVFFDSESIGAGDMT